MRGKQQERGFRWRGGEIARLEGLSDAVFAFAVTLLVVSLEVPKNFEELTATIRQFVPFGICFALLLQIWHEQYRYFRRYNLQDSASTVLNCVLLFVVLFYVYPLKFLFTYLVNTWMGAPHAQLSQQDVARLMEIFSGGYLAVALIFMLLFGHALRLRGELEMDPREIFLTRASIGAAAVQAVTALASLGLAFSNFATFSGLIYPILLGPGLTVYYTVVGRKRRRLDDSMSTAV